MGNAAEGTGGEPVDRKLAIKIINLEKLTPYARNARTHSDDQIAQLAGSIREFGWTNPILIDEQRSIIAGHARVLAARRLGLKSVPTITLSGLSETQRRALVLIDNRLPLNAGWNVEMLANELKSLADFDMTKFGFTGAELKSILQSVDANAPSEIAGGFAFRLIVDCADEKQQGELMARLESEGFVCKPLVS